MGVWGVCVCVCVCVCVTGCRVGGCVTEKVTWPRFPPSHGKAKYKNSFAKNLADAGPFLIKLPYGKVMYLEAIGCMLEEEMVMRSDLRSLTK